MLNSKDSKDFLPHGVFLTWFCYRVMTSKRFCARSSWAFLQCEQIAFISCAVSQLRCVIEKAEKSLGCCGPFTPVPVHLKIGILASSALKPLDNGQLLESHLETISISLICLSRRCHTFQGSFSFPVNIDKIYC
jgi:hypothetical protein